MARVVLAIFGFAGVSRAQMVGSMKKESPVPMGIARCTKSDGCELEVGRATMDANWRWVHGQDPNCQSEGCTAGGNCFDGDWSPEFCSDPDQCAANCALEGVDKDSYENTYGITLVEGGLKLGYVNKGQDGGVNVGSRLFLLETPTTYKLFKLKNREFAFDVDVSTLPCGVSGALYFVEMEADGGMGKGNQAGAAYGTGYCNAKCPHQVHFVNGRANTEKWNKTEASGAMGACCAEMDVWEANGAAAAFTAHACEHDGAYVCNGTECGDEKTGETSKSVCDKDGCSFNPFRMGEEKFFGNSSDFTIDSSKPLTVVTQWLTSDGTDDGDLVEIRRLYMQDGQVIQNSKATALGSDGADSITDIYCDAQKEKFSEPNQHKAKGGLKSLGNAMDRGMVLVMSLQDDARDHMDWLDSVHAQPTDLQSGKPGTKRGPCSRESGVPEKVRERSGDAYVKYYNIMYGEIDSTYTASSDSKPAALEAHWVPQEHEQSSQQLESAMDSQQNDQSRDSWEQQQQQQQQQPEDKVAETQETTTTTTTTSTSQDLESVAQGIAAAAMKDAEKAVQSQSSGISTCGQAWAQCAGDPEWTGEKCCQGSCTCEYTNGQKSGPGTYGQCVPASGDWECGAATSSANQSANKDNFAEHMEQKFEAHTPWHAASSTSGMGMVSMAGLGMLASATILACSRPRGFRRSERAEVESLVAQRVPSEMA